MKLWFLTDSAVVWPEWRLTAANTLDLGGGVDGAEAMTIGLCQHLAGRGHEVTLWATHLETPGTYGYGNKRVQWRSAERELRQALLNEPSPDVFIAIRRPEVFSLLEFQMGCSAFRLLWAHDVFDHKQAQYLANVDATVYMSQWHRKQWEESCPPLAFNNFFGWITPAALEPDWIPEPSMGDHNRHTYIYSSRPERGLVPLMEMWPEIRRQIPDATLLVTGYTAGTSVLVNEADRIIASVSAAVGGIETVRSPDKRGFYKQLRRARLMLYPGVPWFHETNGHVTSEAMVCGTIPIVTKIGALEETIPDLAGITISGDSSSMAYQNEFIRAVVSLSSERNDNKVNTLREVGYRHVIDRCSYASVARHWEQSLHSLPHKEKRLWTV